MCASASWRESNGPSAHQLWGLSKSCVSTIQRAFEEWLANPTAQEPDDFLIMIRVAF